MSKKTGLYIALEGGLKTGKTTQRERLVAKLTEKYPDRQIAWTREPGGQNSEISHAIRVLVQGTKFSEEMNPITEAYLYAAARAQSIRLEVTPVLKNGGIVVSDRTVYTSIVFQGMVRGAGRQVIEKINECAIKEVKPDVVIVLDLPAEVAMSRVDDLDGDKFEHMGLDFFQSVRRGYMTLVKSEPNLFKVVDALGTPDEVETRISQILNRGLKLR